MHQADLDLKATQKPITHTSVIVGMKHIKWPIFITTALLFVYVAMARFESLWHWVFALFLILHVALVYMVYAVLKNGKPSSYTFKERFYDDIANDELGIM